MNFLKSFVDTTHRSPLVNVNCETFSHAVILGSIRREGCNETNSPEGEYEDQRDDWQLELARKPHQDDACPGVLGLLFLLVLIFSRLDLYHIHLCGTKASFSLEHLLGGVLDHLKEGDGHCEQHPDVNHLDVRGGGQALREAKKTKNKMVRHLFEKK